MTEQYTDGIIIKGIGGFYYVEAANEVYECKVRGVFRKKGIKPLAGDRVSFLNDENNSHTIEKIYDRKTKLIRPQVANIEQLIIVVSTCDPKPNILNIDKMIAFALKNNIEPILIFTKTDMCEDKKIRQIYDNANIKNISFSAKTKLGVEDIREVLKDKISAFAGNTGVGKSTVLNTVYENLNLETGITSKKLGRGKHTTRTVELFKLPNEGYVADSPGFSTIDIIKYGINDKTKLIQLFPDLIKYTYNCKFVSCTHTCESGCELIEALKNNKVEKSRYDSYVAMYNELKDIKDWQLRKE